MTLLAFPAEVLHHGAVDRSAPSSCKNTTLIIECSSTTGVLWFAAPHDGRRPHGDVLAVASRTPYKCICFCKCASAFHPWGFDPNNPRLNLLPQRMKLHLRKPMVLTDLTTPRNVSEYGRATYVPVLDKGYRV